MKKITYFVFVIILSGFMINAENISAQGLTIVAFGDSITAPRESVVTYSDVIREEFRKKEIPARVINAGIGGNTTAHAKARFETDVLAHNPDLVIIQFGTNDAAIDVWKKPPATKTRVDIKDYEKNLREFIAELKKRKAKIILVTPLPLRWTPKTKEMYGKPPYKPDDPDGFNVLIGDYVKVVKKIGAEEKVKVINLFSAYYKYHETKGQTMDDLFSDGMHPNNKGQMIEAGLLLEEIKKMKLGL